MTKAHGSHKRAIYHVCLSLRRITIPIMALTTSVCFCVGYVHAQVAAIDSGSGSPITASDGTKYSADPGPPAQDYDYGTYSNFCSTGNGSSNIAGTSNPKIYQTVRAASTFNYSIPVPNGCYEVDLRFVECSYNSRGQRLMTANFNGSVLAGNIDIFANAGVANRYVLTFPAQNVTNGNASLTMTAGVAGENAVLSAWDIWPSSGCTNSGNPPPPPSHFLIVILENTNASDALAQPYMGGIVNGGYTKYLGNYHAIAHPSQPNYIAMVSGSTQGVTDDNNHNVNVSHLGDLLEAKGLSWKVYAEDYPGGCFTGDSGNYVRKHNPFMSFTNINGNSSRCAAHIVNASQFFTDEQNGKLPTVAFYIPNLRNDGHDTSVAFADNWLSSTLGPIFGSDAFWAQNPAVVLTFDENDSSNDTTNNQVYAAIFGNTTQNGTISEVNYNHYSLLRMIEDAFALGNLGLNDASAVQMNDVFQ